MSVCVFFSPNFYVLVQIIFILKMGCINFQLKPFLCVTTCWGGFMLRIYLRLSSLWKKFDIIVLHPSNPKATQHLLNYGIVCNSLQTLHTKNIISIAYARLVIIVIRSSLNLTLGVWYNLKLWKESCLDKLKDLQCWWNKLFI